MSTKERNEQNGLSCPVCQAVFPKLEELQSHFKACSVKLNKKIDEIKITLAEKKVAENSDLSCKKCGKTFKKVIAKNKHSCEAKSTIAQTQPPSFPLPESNSREFSCVFCQKVIPEVPNLKKHYIVEHFQDFFRSWSKVQEYPVKCCAPRCELMYSNLADYSIHLGLDHKRLFKAFHEKQKKGMLEFTGNFF